MKTKQFSDQIRECAKLNRDIILPTGQRTYRTWPLCLTCFKEVDACELKNVNDISCEILAKCSHGTDKVYEDYYKVLFPFRCDGDPLEDERANWAIKRAMHDFCPFNPSHMENTSKR